MEASTIIATALAVLSSLIAAYSQIKTKTLETAFLSRGVRTRERLDAQQQNFENLLELYDKQEERIQRAERVAIIAGEKADTAERNRRSCEFRLARLEAILDVRGLLPEGWHKADEDDADEPN